MSTRELIVASIRLPVALEEAADGSYRAKASPGGLATALRAVADKRPFTWIGWPGLDVPEGDQDAARKALAEVGGEPVFITPDEHQGFYEEFSNRVLWPLFHMIPTPLKFDREAWEHYKTVNHRFASAIAKRATPNATIWIHDYQLALVPGLLREWGVDAAVGFFLHIPFPSSETFRTLPVREDLLNGMLGADFVGFHAYDYAGHFRSSALRVLGLESTPDKIWLPTHHAHISALPIGIDPDDISTTVARPDIEKRYQDLAEQYAERTVILGVDRLDYTKGIPQKLLAFGQLLEDNPELHDNVVFIQVASPSRTRVAEYQSLRREIDELVGHVNGTFGTLTWTPVVYINQHVPRDQLMAMYRLAEIMLVTPVRDGMNLVCLEYIAARGEKPGALVLSEFAGAATCISGAKLVNPHDVDHIAQTLADCLDSGSSQEDFAHLREFALENTSIVWAERCLRRIEEAAQSPGRMVQRLDMATAKNRDLASSARKPMVFLDYDGTLVPHVRVPSQARPTPRVRTLLSELAERALVYVVSGRPAETLDEWLGDLDIGFVCEHGLARRGPGEPWGSRIKVPRRVLEEQVGPLLQDFTERTPGSRVEIKSGGLAWHYRGSEPKLGAWRAKELRTVLENTLSGNQYNVLAGSKVVEVRHNEATKGNAVSAILDAHPECDFAFCAGNDRTDEDMFAALAEIDLPRMVCFVGSVHSSADYHVDDPGELLDQLAALAALWPAAC